MINTAGAYFDYLSGPSIPPLFFFYYSVSRVRNYKHDSFAKR